MKPSHLPGPGKLVDAGAARHCRDLGLAYRPRYTPVLRALLAGHGTVTKIVAHGRLTGCGKAVLVTLQDHWRVTFAAIKALEAKTGHPLRQVLQDAADALKRSGFAARLRLAALEQETQA